MKQLLAVGGIVIVVTTLLNAVLSNVQLLPVAASAQAVPIDHLFGLHFQLIAFLFSLIVVFMFYSVVVFRRKPGETGDGDHFEGHTGLEIAWTIFPLMVVAYFSYIGGTTLAETRKVDPQAIEINVIASQWSWRFEYPEYGISSTTLNLPLNRQALLKLTSTDVIHSFWVPEFRVKQDALPGKDMVKDLRVTPTVLGAYKVRCAELCGTAHAYMESPVVVMHAEEFEKWATGELESASSETDPVVRGEKWAKQFGCTGCHSIDGTTLVGPTWKGLDGKQEPLADGSAVTVDDAYLLESITAPGAKVVAGFQNIMPANLAEQMTEEQLADLIAFIKSLK
jgi:cytochrome c oxidase subunit 2